MARILTHMHAHLTKIVNGDIERSSETYDEHDFRVSGQSFDEVIEEYKNEGYDSVTLKLEWSDE